MKDHWLLRRTANLWGHRVGILRRRRTWWSLGQNHRNALFNRFLYSVFRISLCTSLYCLLYANCHSISNTLHDTSSNALFYALIHILTHSNCASL